MSDSYFKAARIRRSAVERVVVVVAADAAAGANAPPPGQYADKKADVARTVWLVSSTNRRRQ